MPHHLPIRPARLSQDAERILEVFAAAKGIMVADGNTKQWAYGDERLAYQKIENWATGKNGSKKMNNSVPKFVVPLQIHFLPNLQ